MSYILEALKKADAAREREREAVPGLHSRHDHPLPDDADDRGEREETARASRTPWLAAGIAAGVVIAGALFWLLGRPQEEVNVAEAPRQAPTGGQVREEGVATTPRESALTPAPQVVAKPLAELAAPKAVAPSPPQAPKPQVIPPDRQVTAPMPATTATRPEVPQADPLRVDPSLKPAAAPVVRMQDLPEAIRRELPPLSVGGAMHSEVAANRMLVLNGGVFREGDQPAPGVVLEEIRLKSAVLSYKGQRYSISY